MTLRLATRSSPLALLQAARVSELLAAAGAGGSEIVTVESEGDRRADVAISQLGSWGAFTNAIEQAVLEGRADVAVHSAKDLPAATDAAQLALGAVPERADPRDVLVGGDLDELPPGALILSGSPRRRAQLAHLRPDLVFGELRGNIERRLARADADAAVVVAVAALQRLALTPAHAEVLPLATMLPMVGQGALALRCRPDDGAALDALRAIDDLALHRALDAERAFLAALGGGCRAPLGALARSVGERGEIHLQAMLASLDGHILLRAERSGNDPLALGGGLARALLAEGGRALVEEGERALVEEGA